MDLFVPGIPWPTITYRISLQLQLRIHLLPRPEYFFVIYHQEWVFCHAKSPIIFSPRREEKFDELSILTKHFLLGSKMTSSSKLAAFVFQCSIYFKHGIDQHEANSTLITIHSFCVRQMWTHSIFIVFRDLSLCFRMTCFRCQLISRFSTDWRTG